MPDPNLNGTVTARCDYCGFEHTITVIRAMKLKVGDPIYTDPTNDEFGRCKRCRRHTLKVTTAETFISHNKPQGFWKVPTDEESSD